MIYVYANIQYNLPFAVATRGARAYNWAMAARRHAAYIEAMNTGSIPVIISDNYVLPFNEVIDWNSCSIRIKENFMII